MAKTLFGDEIAVSGQTTEFGDPAITETEPVPPQPTQEPVSEDVAFDRAGKVWDASIEFEVPLDIADMYFYDALGAAGADPSGFDEPIEDNRVGFSEEFKRQWTGGNVVTKIPITGGIAGAIESLSVINVANRLTDASFDYEGFNRYKDQVSRGGTRGSLSTRILPPSAASREQDQRFIASIIKDFERQQRGLTFGGKVAAGLSQLPTWMIEFAATGGLASLGDDVARKAGEKLLGKYVQTAAGKVAIKAAGLTTGAVVRTSTGLLPRVGEKAVYRQELIELGIAGKESWATSLAKAWGDVAIESFSEEFFGAGSLGGDLIKGTLSKLPFGKKFIASLQDDWIKLTGGSSGDFASRMLTKAGFSSVLGEVGEERIGTILREATGVSDRKGKWGERIWEGIKEDFQPENLGSEIVTLLAPASVRRGMTLGVSLTKGVSVPTEAEQLQQAIEVGEVPFDTAEDAKGYAERAAEVALREDIDVTINIDLADNTVTLEKIEDVAAEELLPLTEIEQTTADFLVSKGENVEDAERIARLSSQEFPEALAEANALVEKKKPVPELEPIAGEVEVIETTPQDFISSRDKGDDPTALTQSTEAELQEFELFTIKGKDAGYGLTPEKDLVSLFNFSGEKGLGTELVIDAISKGVKTLDAFDGFLIDYYEQFGFEEANRVKWDDKFAPPNWDLTKKGRPDIVFMNFKGDRNVERIRREVIGQKAAGEPAGTAETLELAREGSGEIRGKASKTAETNLPELGERGIETGVVAEKRIISKDAFDAALKRLGTIDKLKTGLDPQQIKDAAIVGGYLVETGVRKFADWSKRMIELVGESVKPHLQSIWDGIVSEQAAQPKAEKPKAKVKAKVKPKKKPTKPRVTTAQKKAEDNIRERGFISSIKTALPELRVEGTYIPRSTDKLSIRARNLVKDDIKAAENMALKGNSDKSVAVASELLKHYNEQALLATDETVKDALFEKAATISSDIAAKLTEAGRTVQAAIILSRLTPEGQLRFAAREIQKFNEKIEKTGGGKFGLQKKIPELTPEQSKKIVTEMEDIENMAPGTEKAKKFQKLQNEIADLVPTPLFKKLITIWKAGLLTGLKTQGLNIFANISHLATEKLAKIPATMIDKVIALGTGKRTVTASIQGLGSGLERGRKSGVDYFRTGYDERDIGTKLDYKRVNMGEGRLARALQRYTEIVFRLLGAADQPFYYATKMMSLYEQAKVEAINAGLKGKEAQSYIDNLLQNPTEDMVKNASKDAEAAVFQNKTKLGDLAKGIQELGGGVGEIVVPFGRTPSAVAMQIINYSPVGAVKTIIENIGKGKFNQRDFVTGLGRSIVGAIPLVIGAALWEEDMLTLDFPKTEKERQLWKIEGRKANSIKVDGKWRTIQSFGPAGNLLVVGGHFRRAFLDSGSPSEAMATALFGSAKSFTEQTFLQGVNQFTSALQDPERSGPRLARGLVSSVIPTISGDIARARDPLERRTGSVAARVKAKIPFLRETLEPQITVLGEERRVTANPIEIMIDPTRPSKDISTPVVKELRRLFDAGFTATPSLLGNRDGYDALTDKENTELWKRTGQITKDALTVMISNQGYKKLNDDQKADNITEVINTSRDVAKSEAVAKQIGGLKGEALTDKIIELSDSGLLTSDLIPGKIIDKLKKRKEKNN
jgi:hypothetical protein